MNALASLLIALSGLTAPASACDYHSEPGAEFSFNTADPSAPEKRMANFSMLKDFSEPL